MEQVFHAAEWVETNSSLADFVSAIASVCDSFDGILTIKDMRTMLSAFVETMQKE